MHAFVFHLGVMGCEIHLDEKTASTPVAHADFIQEGLLGLCFIPQHGVSQGAIW